MSKEFGCDCCATNLAVLEITRNLAGVGQTLRLCAACAREQGIRAGITVLPVSAVDMLEPLLDPLGCELLDQQCCSQCGTTFPEIRTTGLVGCVHCFDEFRTAIRRLLPRITQRPLHIGSIPQRLQAVRRLFADKLDLSARLDAALQAENYEAAAHLRDVLRDLDSHEDQP